MIEHPLPTPATAKFLYAHAIRCAYNNCNEPLYCEDAQSGTWVLNSRICHISARSEGGPRWDDKQSPEENRSASNLLIMCPVHASTIDDRHAVQAFPPTLLQEWKASQIREHAEAKEGWPLTNAMARHALTASFSDVDIAINNSSIDLGGKGGSAPGAGGGGGGAIGPNARSGSGGHGGTIDVRGGALSALDSAAEIGKYNINPAPGSGGGGAGAYGRNAVAGDGGDGGNCVIDGFPVEPGDLLEIEVGEGGVTTGLPGNHGGSGGDSVIFHKSADGALKRIVRATGGKSTKSGKIPDDWTTISLQDLKNGLHISTLMPVNAVEFNNGLAYILGGGWAKFHLRAIPTQAVWNVVCVASWGRGSSQSRRGVCNFTCLTPAALK